MRDYAPLPSWKRKEQAENRMIWAAIALTWFLLSIDAITKI